MVVVVASALALSAVYSLGHPNTWWVELTRYAPYPAYALPAAAAVALSLLLGRWWRVAALLAFALVVTLVMGLVLASGDREGSGGVPVRLMTYNIKAYLARDRPDGFARLAREVVLHDPDVVVMQDANGGLESQPEAYLPELAALVGSRQMFRHGQYVVASRYPLKNCRPGSMPIRGDEHTYVRCTLVVKGTEIELVTAHFVSPREGLNAARHERLEGIGEWEQNFKDRLTQSRKLAADLAGNLASQPRPLIVAGDLNSLESSPVIRTLLNIGLRDAFSSAGWGYGYTQGHALRTGFSFLRIDHILVSPALGVARCFVGGKEASEHRPVIADLFIKPQ